jgi:hypothetical protein
VELQADAPRKPAEGDNTMAGASRSCNIPPAGSGSSSLYFKVYPLHTAQGTFFDMS